VKRELKHLKDSGKIERIGSDKTGEWKVLSVE
jgi:predicted HTH transcriptional regulator